MSEVQLKVEDARQRDVYRGIARIDQQTMQKLSISAGDVIEIVGKRNTAAIAWPAYSEDQNREIIRIDGFTRKNAGVAMHELVTIRPAKVTNATTVVLAPIDMKLNVDEDFTNFVKNRLMERTFVEGDTTLVMMLGHAIPFRVTKSRPHGIVRINHGTTVQIMAEPAPETKGVPRTTYEDIGGLHEEIQRIREMVELPLRHPELFQRLGIDPPKGVLLHGPPGCGKTLLARAVANESEANFYSINGPEIMSKFYGESEARLREMFQQAQKNAPSIVFIDELDAMGRARGASPFAGGHDEKEQTLNQLLVEMDGFDPTSGIVLLAATNRPEVLDPALLRAGRFDRQVLVDRPDKRGRRAVLEVHVKKVKLDASVDLEQVAALTPGFTGADLANLVNEAALAATRRGADSISLDDFNTGIERIVAGLERKNRLLNPREREIVAYHEMGHAIVAAAITGSDPVHKVSIIPRGIGALGYTIQRPTEDRYLMTRTELENRMAVLMGGRAAEHVVFEHFSTGAADDLAKIADIARSIVTRYAMVPDFGHVALETEQRSLLGPSGEPVRQRLYGDDTAREIDCAVRNTVLTAFARATAILRENRELLEQSARLLLAKETLDTSDLERLFASVKAAPPEIVAATAPCSGSGASAAERTPT